MSTIVVMGDIGAQLRVFYSTLRRLGVSSDLLIPDGLIIVNVGDVARMSDNANLNSLECVKLADELLRRNPGRWIQILGNHESAFIGGPSREHWFDFEHFDESQKIVSGWWKEGIAQLGQVIQTPETSTDIVVTHAGLTSGFMEDNGFLGDHRGMVKFINSVDYPDISQTGVVIFGDEPSPSTDCLWAASSAELYPSWNREKMGFHQIHGHDIPLFSWEGMTVRDDMTETMRKYLTIDPVKRHVRYEVPSGEFIDGIDWVLKNKAHADSSTWEMKFLPEARLINL